MQRQEEYRNLSIQIKYIEGKFRKSGTTFVTKKQTDGRILDITDKTPLEKLIISANVKKYHQTSVAFLLLDDPQLYSDISAFDEVPQVEAIIDGTYVCPDDTYPSVKTFLRQLKRPPTVSGKEPAILTSFTKYIAYWKKVKENISLQGPHIRMYKAAAHNHLLGWIFHRKSGFPYLSWYSICQNCTCTDVMLMKHPTH